MNRSSARVRAAIVVEAGSQPADHLVYRDNVFQRGSNGKCGAFGPVTDFNPAGVGNAWTNNTWDSGEQVPPN